MAKQPNVIRTQTAREFRKRLINIIKDEGEAWNYHICERIFAEDNLDRNDKRKWDALQVKISNNIQILLGSGQIELSKEVMGNHPHQKRKMWRAVK